jgi:hypothetical protein
MQLTTRPHGFRLEDTSYATRMMISYLMSETILEETGYGIFAVNSAQLSTMGPDRGN